MALLGVLATLGCGGAVEAPDLRERDQSILRGALAASATLNHTGGLVAIDRSTHEPRLFCTATLIAPETVVTAKHCALAVFDAEQLQLDVAWLAGPSVAEAEEVIPVVAVELAPGNSGGFLGIGSDVAVAHLEHATAIPPVEPVALDDDRIGQAMVSIGYGMFSPEGDEDQRRRIGSETVASLHGRVLAAIFGDFESYVEWDQTGEVTSLDILQLIAPGNLLGQLALLRYRQQFDSLLLLDGYEAVTGREAGDTQTCSGDSGGPLALQKEDGSWQTYGVVSGGLFSLHSVCDYGSVFATFGPDTLAFLQSARGWRDPCGELPVLGECRGSVAVRCETALLDGLRRPLERDCAADGQECFLAPDGAACHEP